MHSLVRFGKTCYAARILLLVAVVVHSGRGSISFQVASDDPGPWPHILSSVGFRPDPGGPVKIFVVLAGETASPDGWAQRVESGVFLILEGDSPAAQFFGFRPTAKRVRVTSVEDLRRPSLSIVWERPVDLPVFDVPNEARIFTRERWHQAPLVAGYQRGAGAVLWVAATPGEKGYERFPYLLHALADLGLQAPFRSKRLWAFFDSSYRLRVDLDYFAEIWRSAGIAALHVAAWHFYEPDPDKDKYLRALIESCHRRGILIYAWLELPHVSEKFWEEHPEWREKTALLQDAHLDWRRLMNLSDRDCFRAVSTGIRSLLDRFDWDGVNLAELYFESLQGHSNPSRFTPMNDDVRREFRKRSEFDPVDLFDSSSPQHYSKNEARLREFLDFRAELSGRMQKEWLAEIEAMRRAKPDLDLVLTHVDDRFDTRMRDAIGADAARLVPLIDRHNLTFLIEDPATVWNLGPERYTRIAEKYLELTPHVEKLAIDINIVERYQDVYPTKQQTGTELFQLVSHAARAFPRVALYFENSILTPDVPWLASAAAVVDRFEQRGAKLTVDSPYGLGISWEGPALVDGRLWPVADADALWLTPGPHAVERARTEPRVRMLDFSADLTTVATLPNGLEFAYESGARALAIFDKHPERVEVDGLVVRPRILDSGTRFTVYLPRGQHVVAIEMESLEPAMTTLPGCDR
jgi:hypothetical protein